MSKTIEVLPETGEETICLRLTGTITTDDFIQNFDNLVKDRVGKYGRYNLFAYYDADFQGWEPEAADLSFKCISTLGKMVVRAAYINPPESRFLMMKILKPILTGEVRYFNADQYDEAMEWAKTGKDVAKKAKGK